jgi:hypothetical protein
MPRILFPAFFEAALEQEKVMMETGTYKRHKSVVKKLIDFNPELTLTFMDMDSMWFEKYKRHLTSLGNQKTTIAANITSIKKFLLIAQKTGIKLKVNLEEIKAGSKPPSAAVFGIIKQCHLSVPCQLSALCVHLSLHQNISEVQP